MSLGGGDDPFDDDDDDDFEEIKDELRRLNNNFERFIEALSRQQPPQDGDGEDESIGGGVDLWDQGRVSSPVSTVQSYINERIVASEDDDITTPYYTGDDPAAFYFDVFREGGEHLQKIYFALSDDQFDDFVRRWSIRFGVNDELLDILKPSKEFLGVQDVGGQVKIITQNCVMSYLDMYNATWYFPSSREQAAIQNEFEENTVISPDSPAYNDELLEYVRRNYTAIGKLLIPMPTGADSILDLRASGGATPNEINIEMAGIIDSRENLELPANLRRRFLGE